jgi:3-hydroxyisobutyrate dehydrogenase-like beta-hydroxyacid dehydrogenase
MIAVLGTGAMGTPIARRLLDAGHPVAVWNRTAARAGPLAAAGARLAATPAEAARGATVVITMLTDGPAVESVLFGPDGAVSSEPSTVDIVEMSTIGPEAIRRIAARLPAGVGLVDAPVGGSTNAAADGTLRIFAGGADDAVTRVTPVLEVLGTVRRCGALGEGAALKVVLNAALVAGITALADVLAVARALGIDRAVALEALTGGALGGAVERSSGGSSFAIALAHKDIALALDAEPGDVPLLRAAERVLQRAPDPAADLSNVTTTEVPA